jgi:methylmalonyl-CoA/ethylmalonyl-CoA epimerase
MIPAPPASIDHVGIAVSSIASALGFWRDALGLTAGEPEEVPSEGVRVVFLPMGESRLELLEALTPESPIARFIDKRGEGIHHICFRVADLESTLSALEQKGARPIAPRIRVGAGGRRIAFVHPGSTGGILLELKEYPKAP